jgi:hypothetical protein
VLQTVGLARGACARIAVVTVHMRESVVTPVSGSTFSFSSEVEKLVRPCLVPVTNGVVGSCWPQLPVLLVIHNMSCEHACVLAAVVQQVRLHCVMAACMAILVSCELDAARLPACSTCRHTWGDGVRSTCLNCVTGDHCCDRGPASACWLVTIAVTAHTHAGLMHSTTWTRKHSNITAASAVR